MKIARLNEKIKIKLEDVTVIVTPLSGSKKIEMTSMVKASKEGKLTVDKAAQELFLVKHSVKALEGLKDLDDKEYQLSFTEEGGPLTDECAEEVLSFLVNTYFTIAMVQSMKGLFGVVTNPYNGMTLEGISTERIVPEGDEKK
jgi:hypothetical protein